MKFKLLFILSVVFCFSSSAQQKHIGDGQDTLVFRDSSKMAVHVIEIGRQSVSYKIDQSAEEIHYTSFYRLKEVRLGNGEIITSEAQMNYSIQLGRLRGQLDNKSKRSGHLLISTHPTSLIGYQAMDPESRVINVGLSYFLHTKFSVGAYYYQGLNDTREPMPLENGIYYSSSPTYESGFEINAAFMSSKIRALDFGIRVGYGNHTFSYHSIRYNTIYNYKEDANGYHDYNGNSYVYDSESREQISRELKDYSYGTGFINFEAVVQVIPIMSLSASFGLQGAPYVYSNEFFREENYITRYHDTGGNFVGEEINPLYGYGYGAMRLDRQLFARFTLNFHLNTKSGN